MVQQEFTLDRWGWKVKVYYETSPSNADALLRELEDAGCSGSKLRDAENALYGKWYNCGITYSNYRTRSSVSIIGRTTSADEFADSYDHEKGHLAKHICQALHISPWGEEAEYLAGAIAKKTFHIAKHFLCEHCRQRRKMEGS